MNTSQYRGEAGEAVGHTEVYTPYTPKLEVLTATTPGYGESDLDAFEASFQGM